MSTDLVQYQQPGAIAGTSLFRFDDLERMADYFANTKAFGIKNRDEAVMLMLLAQSEGMHPVTAFREYKILFGQPTMTAMAMKARFQKAGGTFSYLERGEQKVKVQAHHPQGGTIVVEWTIARATKAGLPGKNDNWAKYPTAMLDARACSEAIRALLPGVVLGLYTPEETGDMPEIQARAPRTEAAAQPSRTHDVIEATYSTEAVAPKRGPAPNPGKIKFVEIAGANGKVFEDAVERAIWANRCLGRKDDSREAITVADWLRASEVLPALIETERAVNGGGDPETPQASLEMEEDPFGDDDTPPSPMEKGL